MKLTGWFTGDKQAVDNSSKHQVNTTANNSLINRQIYSLAPGQTIQGELVTRNGSEVQIKLADDMIIKARMDRNINLEIGKTITFEVKNSGQSLLLSPLYANVATDANVLKALDMASLPVNESTIQMTELMMKAGLSIDRNSLQQVFRESNLYTNADIRDIVDLHKLSMPVNEGNLSQITSYKNLTHQLTTGVNQCLEALPDTMQNLIQSGSVAGAEKLYQELLNMIQGSGGNAGGTGNTSLSMESLNTEQGLNSSLIQTADGQLMVLSAQADGQSSILHFPGDSSFLQTLLQPENAVFLQNLAQGDNSQLVQALAEGDSVQLLQTLTQYVDEVQGPANTNESRTAQNGFELLQNVSPKGDIQLLQVLMQGNNRQALQGLLQSGNGQLLQLLAQSASASEHGARIVDFSDFLKANLQKQWTITPQEVADAKQVEQLYNRLDKHLKNMTQVLENVNQTGSEAYRATVSLSRNLDFLQQINQAYTFVQFPLRLQQGNNAHGELFVYTNKKHLAAKDGQISALLHLDMEHLGAVDVYVAMQNENVNTKFYVQDDEMLDFLAEHVDLLTKRLNARGYQCNCEMQTRESLGEEHAGSGIGQVLAASGHIPMVQYAFDVRT